jgi:outer membrane protein OmpA-like peptidoglycan-associated protein
MVLRNIFFDTGKFDLKGQSLVELKKLLNLLNENPEINIEIRGHTDNTGGEEFNMQLSQNRARAVFDFLVAEGISRDRLRYKGYGFSEPLSDNESEEGRQRNRRTEIKILDTGQGKN